MPCYMTIAAYTFSFYTMSSRFDSNRINDEMNLDCLYIFRVLCAIGYDYGTVCLSHVMIKIIRFSPKRTSQFSHLSAMHNVHTIQFRKVSNGIATSFARVHSNAYISMSGDDDGVRSPFSAPFGLPFSHSTHRNFFMQNYDARVA